MSKPYCTPKVFLSNFWGAFYLEKQPYSCPTPALKETVVRLILEKGIPLAHVRMEFRIGKTALQRWVSMVRYHSYKGEVGKVAPNIIARDFVATAPNRKWATELPPCFHVFARAAPCVASGSGVARPLHLGNLDAEIPVLTQSPISQHRRRI